jgi:hypothetical protein
MMEFTAALTAHRMKLAGYEAMPPHEKDWIVQGSIAYHRDAIRHLEHMRNRSQAEPTVDKPGCE